MSKNLLCLTCNPGAFKGDYLIGLLWTQFHKELCGEVKFSAVDSIISLLHNDGKGAIVLYPEEMSRVKNYDIHSTIEMFNPTKPKGMDRLIKHTEALKIGIQRIFPDYDHIYIALNTEPYKFCMACAINETKQWDKVTFYDQLAGCWNRRNVLTELKKDLHSGKPRCGIVHVQERTDIDPKYINRWLQFRSTIPTKWKYWDWKELYV
jgi:hypothetical protein